MLCHSNDYHFFSFSFHFILISLTPLSLYLSICFSYLFYSYHPPYFVLSTTTTPSSCFCFPFFPHTHTHSFSWSFTLSQNYLLLSLLLTLSWCYSPLTPYSLSFGLPTSLFTSVIFRYLRCFPLNLPRCFTIPFSTLFSCCSTFLMVSNNLFPPPLYHITVTLLNHLYFPLKFLSYLFHSSISITFFLSNFLSLYRCFLVFLLYIRFFFIWFRSNFESRYDLPCPSSSLRWRIKYLSVPSQIWGLLLVRNVCSEDINLV